MNMIWVCQLIGPGWTGSVPVWVSGVDSWEIKLCSIWYVKVLTLSLQTIMFDICDCRWTTSLHFLTLYSTSENIDAGAAILCRWCHLQPEFSQLSSGGEAVVSGSLPYIRWSSVYLLKSTQMLLPDCQWLKKIIQLSGNNFYVWFVQSRVFQLVIRFVSNWSKSMVAALWGCT